MLENVAKKMQYKKSKNKLYKSHKILYFVKNNLSDFQGVKPNKWHN